MLSLISLREWSCTQHKVPNLTFCRINENGRFNRPKDGASKDDWATYDNDLFQTGRLITCGLYVNCVLKDYVRTILNLVRTGTKWDLDPRTEEGKNLFSSPAAEGVGNSVSAEFNLSEFPTALSVSLTNKKCSLPMAFGNLGEGRQVDSSGVA